MLRPPPRGAPRQRRHRDPGPIADRPPPLAQPRQLWLIRRHGRGQEMAATPVAVEVWRGDRARAATGALLRRGRCRSAAYVGRRRRRARVPAFRGQAVPGAGAGGKRCRRRVRCERRELALACASHGGEPDAREPWWTLGWRASGSTRRRSPAARIRPLFAPAAAALIRSGRRRAASQQLFGQAYRHAGGGAPAGRADQGLRAPRPCRATPLRRSDRGAGRLIACPSRVSTAAACRTIRAAAALPAPRQLADPSATRQRDGRPQAESARRCAPTPSFAGTGRCCTAVMGQPQDHRKDRRRRGLPRRASPAWVSASH